MSNKTISLSDEAEVSLEKKRKEDVNFNLSAFVSACLMKDFGTNGKSIEELNSEINKKKAQIQLLDAEINGMVNQIKETLDKNEHLQTEQERQYKLATLSTDMSIFWSSISDIDKEEYKQGIKDGKWKSSIEFFKLKTGWKDE